MVFKILLDIDENMISRWKKYFAVNKDLDTVKKYKTLNMGQGRVGVC
jgi:hypothetical protein